jgi:rubrerythrin
LVVNISDAPASRRKLLEISAGGGAALLITGCGRSHPELRKLPPSVRHQEVAILTRALDLERAAIDTYTAGIPLLSGRVLKAAKHFLEQELSHAGELSGLIKDAGGKPGKPKSSYALGHPRSAKEVLRLLHEVERAEIAYYLQSIPSLSTGPLRAAIAAIVGNDAQHLMILRSALSLPGLPSALVTGSE